MLATCIIAQKVCLLMLTYNGDMFADNDDATYPDLIYLI